MLDMFVGDIGDFANNGLLRWLCGLREPTASDGHGQLDLAIVSYFRRPDQNDKRKGYGGVTGYLSNIPANCHNFKKCDPELYLALRKLVFSDRRKLNLMQQFHIPGACTTYYNDLINGPIGRMDWLRGAGRRVRDAQLVFLNPDIGIHARDERPVNRGSDKHLYLSDLDTILNGEQSFVIYHHVRGRTPQEIIEDLVPRIRARQNLEGLELHVLQFSRWVSRLYFIGIHPNQYQVINNRRLSFLDPNVSQWSANRNPRFPSPHFTVP